MDWGWDVDRGKKRKISTYPQTGAKKGWKEEFLLIILQENAGEGPSKNSLTFLFFMNIMGNDVLDWLLFFVFPGEGKRFRSFGQGW